jgi:hypothetical protein
MNNDDKTVKKKKLKKQKHKGKDIEKQFSL